MQYKFSFGSIKVNTLNKVFTFILIYFFLILKTNGQVKQNEKNYLVYYDLINNADMFEFEKKHEQALAKYMEAFKYANAFETDFSKAIEITLSLKKHKLTLFFLKERTLKTGGFTPEELYDSLQFAAFLNTKYGKNFEDNYEKWLALNKKTYDLYAHYLVSQIDATDQVVRVRLLNKYKNNFKNDSIYWITRTAVIGDIDSVNFIRFKNFVKNQGFPGRSKLGGKALYTSAFFKHIFKYDIFKPEIATKFELDKFYYLDSLLRIQLIIGEIVNENFAYCYDYSLGNDSISYYAYPRYTFNDSGERVLINFPVIDPENLNKRRVEIGLMTIEDQCKINNAPLPSNYKRKNE